jgi:soluble lytic murein transglycosylase-like protein
MGCQQNLAPLIIAEANRQSVPTSIALAVAQRESGMCHWNADGSVKVGAHGEIGVFQVMPATAPFTDLTDVYANISAGVGYLADMYAEFGSWATAIAAYNWGPSKVQNALASGGSFPAAVNNYVAAIVGSADIDTAAASSPVSYSGSSNLAKWAIGISGGLVLLLLLE